MSGIFGIFRRKGAPVHQVTLDAMRDSMMTWGVDSQNSWLGPNCGMGFLLAHNTPESFFEDQPIVDSNLTGLVICADARIDNRSDLCRHLHLSSQKRDKITDGELIRLAYLKWGQDFPKQIVGAFAVAIWDSEKQTLQLSRDHMGFRPLYVYQKQDVVIFASDVEAILATKEMPRKLNEKVVLSARAQYTPDLLGVSLITGITKVPPANTTLFTPNTISTSTYWDPTESSEIRYRTDEQYANALQELFLETTQSSIRSAFPIGSHLSGGLDSSAVSIAASHLLQQSGSNLAGTFAWSPAPQPDDYPLRDERARIEEVCKQINLNCTYSTLTTDDIISVWTADISTRPQDTMFDEVPIRREANRLGIRTMLSGWGGDEFATFSGSGFYSEQLIQRNYSRLLREMRLSHKVRGVPYRSLLIKHLFWPLLPDACYARRKNLLPHQLESDSHVSKTIKQKWRQHATNFRPQATIRQNQLNSIRLGWLTYRVESWTTRAVDRALEYRYPLLDRRLIEFCMGLPSDQFVQNGWSRYIFRNAVTSFVPHSICWGDDNKIENAKSRTSSRILADATDRWINLCETNAVDANVVSCMWKDKLSATRNL